MTTVAELADIVGGELVRGDAARRITGVMPIESASPDSVTFVGKAQFLPLLASTGAAAVLTSRALATEAPDGVAVIAVESPYLAFAQAATHFAAPVPRPQGVHPTAVVDPSAVLGDGVVLGAHVVIGPRARIAASCVMHPGVHVEADAEVGERSILYNHVVVRHGCRVGARCILHPGVVIGADGFGFVQDRTSGRLVHVKVPQTGTVVVEDDVEIGANSCVDRATLGVTRIGAGTKIDNLVQIGHNVEVGEACILVAQSGVAGSSKVGKRAILGGQAGVSGHLKVGEDAIVLGQAGVLTDIAPGEKVGGHPAIPATRWFRNHGNLAKLGELFKRVRELEKLVKNGSGR